MSFNWLDFVLLVLFAVFIVEGLTRGFSRIVIGLIATITAILLASWCYGVAGSFLLPYVSSPAVANFLGFLLIFIGVQLLGALIGWGIAKVFQLTGLSWLDRAMGAAFGTVKAALIGIALVMILTAFPIKSIPTGVAGSQLAPYAIVGANVLAQLTPLELRTGFEQTYDRLRDLWDKSVPVLKTQTKI